jgi:anti-sigma regulatory factor (Ser/Thr protein kinase)
LNREIESNNISITINLEGTGIIYSVRPMVHSILYNLVSNAVKYRSTDRSSTIQINYREEDSFYIITVTDNGLGIDINRDRDNLFKLYKRFHHHTEGKGLGLYLVKLQAEALGGSISVDSELNRFTTFTVKLKKPENAERQVLYRESFAEVFYDARLNCIGTVWRKTATTEQYTIVMKKIQDFIGAYNTPTYLSDLSHEETFRNFNLENIFAKVVPEVSRQGLARIAVIGPESLKDRHSESQATLLPYGITLEFFTSMAEASKWIEIQNAKKVIKLPDNA